MFRSTTAIILATLAAVLPASAITSRTVRLKTADGVIIFATFNSTDRESAPAVVLVHGLGENRAVWTSFAQLLATNGMASLAIELRGHGESTRKLVAEGAVNLDYREFRPIDFQDMLLDVNAAVDWLLDQPGIDKNRVGIIGASVGANIVLRYAAVNDELAAIVALSPGLVYRGVRTDDVIGKIANRPLRLLVAQDDPFAFESCRRLMEIRKGLEERSSQTEMKACAGNLHGTDLVRGVKGLSEWLAEWLRQTLSTAPPVVGK